jgi:hypothetical protein
MNYEDSYKLGRNSGLWMRYGCLHHQTHVILASDPVWVLKQRVMKRNWLPWPDEDTFPPLASESDGEPFQICISLTWQ